MSAVTVAFFPTIIAGPILSARDLLHRLRERVTLDNALGAQALFLIAIGLTKKIAIADYLSANLVGQIFSPLLLIPRKVNQYP